MHYMSKWSTIPPRLSSVHLLQYTTNHKGTQTPASSFYRSLLKANYPLSYVMQYTAYGTQDVVDTTLQQCLT